MRRAPFLLLVVLLFLATSLTTSNATPPIVHYPTSLATHPSISQFGEILDVNYSTTYAGQKLVVQYYNGSQWLYLQNFSANQVGFTETNIGLNSEWAHYGLNNLRVSSELCSSSPVTFALVSDKSAVYEDLSLYLLMIIVGSALFFALKRTKSIPLILLAIAILYFALSPFTGQRYDTYYLISSGVRILQHVNPFNPGNPQIYPGALKWAYPPIFAFYSAFSFMIYQLLTHSALPSVNSLTWPGFLTSTYNVWEAFAPKSLPVLVSILKVPMVLSAVFTGWFLTKMTGNKSTALIWLLNPVTVLVAAIWGQLDPIATLLAVASLYYFQKDRPYEAYLLASFGAAVKIWPLLMFPIFVVIGLRKHGSGSLKPLIAVLPALLTTLGMYAIFGNVLQTLEIFLYARAVPTYAGKFTVNGLTWQQFPFLAHTGPLPVFLYLGIPAYIFALFWIYYKKDLEVTKWIIISILILFLTYNYVNPQYFYWILPFIILQGRKLFTYIFTALPMLYLLLSYNLFYFVSAGILFGEFSLGPSILEQLKVVYFYTDPFLYLLVSAVLPTLAYFFLLGGEIGKKIPKRIEEILTKIITH
ncbi:MAG: hypothetical protein JRN67_09820 [Nitrososphaerota archaeon]|nr:hypothetical protein [Nitrososphaerota archaeon]